MEGKILLFWVRPEKIERNIGNKLLFYIIKIHNYQILKLIMLRLRADWHSILIYLYQNPSHIYVYMKKTSPSALIPDGLVFL